MDRPLTNDGPQEKTAHGGALPEFCLQSLHLRRSVRRKYLSNG
jgi:hypothetical protein